MPQTSSRPWLDEIEGVPLAGIDSGTDTSRAARHRDPRQRVFLWAAPMIGERLPTRSNFQRVTCLRITGDSAVFRWPTEFPYPRVILAIGTTTEASYLQARVLKTTQDESRQFCVQCEFVERYAPREKK